MTQAPPDYLTTREVADLIRLKERKVYDLVAAGDIPFVRVTGKLLFPRALIEAWLMRHAEFSGGIESVAPRPPICLGSHDPLLDWALREAHSGIAVGFGGSLDGLERFARAEGMMAGMHVPEGPESWNSEHVRSKLPGQPVVLIEWARRQQGLIVAAGNPTSLKSVAELSGRRVVLRQPEAGSFLLLEGLLREAGLDMGALDRSLPPALTQSDVALAVAEGRAEAGFGIAAVAHQYRLGFVPLALERYDLLIWRAAYFEPPVQKLMAFTRTERFAAQAAELGGYDISRLGQVHYNAP
jgi:excisionase family DNA binding protein